jgi:hypothetical protein
VIKQTHAEARVFDKFLRTQRYLHKCFSQKIYS